MAGKYLTDFDRFGRDLTAWEKEVIRNSVMMCLFFKKYVVLLNNGWYK